MSSQHISEALKALTLKGKLKNGLRTAQIETVWQNIMGNAIAKYTEKIEIINQTLFVTTYVGALKNELHFQKTLIIKRINEEFGDTVITDLVIK